MEYTHSELHTHLMGMLSFKGLLDLLYQAKYPGFPVDAMGNLDFKYPVKRTKKITRKIYEQLVVPHGKRVPYSELDTLYRNRASLLADAAGYKIKNPTYRTTKRKELYAKYLNAALLELIDQNVDYVEISFSNIGFIKYMLEHIDPFVSENINFKFLLCTDRKRAVDKLEAESKGIKSMLNAGLAVGFDFMGLELPFTHAEDPFDEESYSINSFKAKLEIILNALEGHEHATLRIHAGENHISRNNPLDTLRMLDEVSSKMGITIPPPEIRLGHAIYFTPSNEYLGLLKKFKCIIEINATSNMALSNIENTRDIDYNFYLDNGIPVVLSTDGGGIYDTSLEQEDEIALDVASSSSYKKILKIDAATIAKKGKL